MSGKEAIHRDAVRLCAICRELIGPLALEVQDPELSGRVQAVRASIELFPPLNGARSVSVDHEMLAFLDDAARELATYAGGRSGSPHYASLQGLGLLISALVDSNDAVMARSLPVYRTTLVGAGYSGEAFDNLGLFSESPVS